jgi:hypothetical protein
MALLWFQSTIVWVDSSLVLMAYFFSSLLSSLGAGGQWKCETPLARKASGSGGDDETTVFTCHDKDFRSEYRSLPRSRLAHLKKKKAKGKRQKQKS